MSWIYKGCGILLSLADVGLIYLGYKLLSIILLLPTWIALQIGAPAIALQVITLFLLGGYIVFWLLVAGLIGYYAVVIFCED